MFRRLRRRIHLLLHGSAFRRDLDEEMAFHIDRLTEDLVRKGMSPGEARREARIRFGSTERVQARSREAQGVALVDEASRNVRFALRSMARSPLYAATFVLTLALCIGLGTAVFGVVDAVLWRPLPYPQPDRLAQAALYAPSLGKNPRNTALDGESWERIRDQGAPLERAVYSGWVAGVNLSTDQAAAYVQQQRVGAGYFRTLGILPQVGREFEAAEDVADGPPVAILSHQLWTRTFGGDPDILGGTIRLKGEAHTVVGIMPAGFESPAHADVWTPLRPNTTGEGSGTNYTVVVRIPPGMTFQEADSRLAGLQAPRPDREGAPELRFGLVPLDQAFTAEVQLPMLILLGAIGIMLVVGCANLAGLQIARSLVRRPEMATRQALGSGSGALVRQMVAENLLLGVLGGGLGLGVAYFGMAGLEALVQSHFGIWQEIPFDGAAVWAAAGITVMATVLFGLAPVLQVANPAAFRTILRGTRVMGGGGHRARKALLVGQVALVTALLFSTGLLVRSYGHLEGLDPGFEPRGLLAVQYSLDDARYTEAGEVQRLFRESLTAIRQVPEVTGAAVALTLPYERPLNTPFHFAGDDEGTNRITNTVYVTPDFFQVMGIPLLQGRAPEEADREGTPLVSVVNQAFADRYLADRPALGALVRMGFSGDRDVTVVGVVGNVQQSAGWGDTTQPVWETPTLYLAASQASGGFFRGIHVWFSPSWVIRTSGSPDDLVASVTRAFREVDPDLPVARMASLEAIMNDAFSQQRFEAGFLIVVSAFALLLAGIGLYGIVAHEVLERRTEMGLRMALGATPGRAVWTAGAGGLRLTAYGLVVGSVAAVGLSRVLQHLVWGVTPGDPLTMAVLLGILALLAGAASFVPAARVGRMDPARILRDG